MRYLGVDLAWAPDAANESGLAALDPDGRVLDAGWSRTLDGTVDWVVDNAVEDAVLFVDAPLVVDNPAGARPCDVAVGQRYGRWKVSALPANLASAYLAGVTLRRRLEEIGWRYDDGAAGPPGTGRVLSECYPYTTLVGAPELGYADERPRYKRKPRGLDAATWKPLRAAACDDLIARLARLERADPPLVLGSHPTTRRLRDEPSPWGATAYKHREDLVDALLCAWTAALWHRYGTARCQVLGQGATIIAPARPEQRPPG